MPVDVQGAGQFRRGLQPVSGQQPSPFLRAVIETGARDPRSVVVGQSRRDVIQAGRGRTIDARDDACDRGGGRERAAIEAAAGVGDLEDRRGLEVLWPRTLVRDKSVIQDIDQRVPPRQRESSRHQVLDVAQLWQYCRYPRSLIPPKFCA